MHPVLLFSCLVFALASWADPSTHMHTHLTLEPKDRSRRKLFLVLTLTLTLTLSLFINPFHLNQVPVTYLRPPSCPRVSERWMVFLWKQTVNGLSLKADCFPLLPWLNKMASAQRTITHILGCAETLIHSNQSFCWCMQSLLSVLGMYTRCAYLHVSACIKAAYVDAFSEGVKWFCMCQHVSRAGHVFAYVGTYQELSVSARVPSWAWSTCFCLYWQLIKQLISARLILEYMQRCCCRVLCKRFGCSIFVCIYGTQCLKKNSK
jgi:hypothetical protein